MDRGEAPDELGLRAERAELEQVLASDSFLRSPTVAQMLRYICEQHLNGQGQDVKEYNIAVEAFKRPPDFDQSRDSIVRVEAHRLRKRLQDYYQAGGANHSIQIVIPSGSYIPRFVRRPGAPLAPILIEEAAVPLKAEPVSEMPPDSTTAAPVPEVVASPDSASPSRRQLTAYALAGMTLIAITILFSLWFSRRQATMVAAAVKIPAPELSPRDEIRILAGSTTPQLADHYGNIWSADRYFDGGQARIATRRHIYNTLDPDIFLHSRQGSQAAFSYHIPLKKGVYELRLYFAETTYGEDNVAGGSESMRVFRIRANGKELIRYFDVIGDALGSNTADIKVFRNIQPADDGMLHLQFAPSTTNDPFVNAIEIVPSQPGAIRPIRIVARDSSLTDERNQVWSADRYFRGGTLVQRHDPVTGASDERLYQNERFGNFSYAIPVALGGRYDVTLKFCESWIGPDRPNGGGAGSRIFDVSFNGRMLLPNFDIWQQAGSLRALDKTFKGLEPNTQGKLIFSFTPSHNYAIVNAIEVVDESWK